MFLIPIAWLYVVLMMALAEALSSVGTVLGAIVTFVLYGLLPVALLLYFMGAHLRGKRRRRQLPEEAVAESGLQPDGSGHAARDAVAPERKEV